MGFPAILSALQPFQICIFNRKNSKLTFTNGPLLMGKRFMANLHASLDSTSKSRISQISTRCQILGESIPQLLIWNSEMNLKIFSNPGGSIWQLTTFDPELRNEFKNFCNPGDFCPQTHIYHTDCMSHYTRLHVTTNAVFAHISSPSSQIWKNSKTKVGHFFSKANILSAHTPMLSSRVQFLPHISSPNSQIWNIPKLKGVTFLEEHFEYPQSYVILKM